MPVVTRSQSISNFIKNTEKSVNLIIKDQEQVKVNNSENFEWFVETTNNKLEVIRKFVENKRELLSLIDKLIDSNNEKIYQDVKTIHYKMLCVLTELYNIFNNYTPKFYNRIKFSNLHITTYNKIIYLYSTLCNSNKYLMPQTRYELKVFMSAIKELQDAENMLMRYVPRNFHFDEDKKQSLLKKLKEIIKTAENDINCPPILKRKRNIVNYAGMSTDDDDEDKDYVPETCETDDDDEDYVPESCETILENAFTVSKPSLTKNIYRYTLPQEGVRIPINSSNVLKLVSNYDYIDTDKISKLLYDEGALEVVSKILDTNIFINLNDKKKWKNCIIAAKFPETTDINNVYEMVHRKYPSILRSVGVHSNDDEECCRIQKAHNHILFIYDN
jgi:hypothetical protein